MRLAILFLFAVLVVGFSYAIPAPVEITSCGTYNSASTTYYLGAPISGFSTCIYLEGDYITLDCRNNAITGDGSGIGIVVDSGNNVTVENCSVQDFDTGVDFSNTANDTLINSTISATSGDGVYLESSSQSVDLSGISVSSQDSEGIYTYNSDNDSFTDIDATSDNSVGFQMDYSYNNIVTDVNASSGTDMGVALDYSYNNTMTDVQALAPGGEYGLYLFGSYNNTLTDISASSGSNYGIYVYGSDNNTFTGLNISSSIYACYLYSSNGNAFSDVIASSNSTAMYIQYSNNNTMSGSWFSSADGNSIYMDNSAGDMFANSTISSTTAIPLDLYYSTYNTFANNTFISLDGNSNLVFIYYSSTFNLFYWNNFTETRGYYIDNNWNQPNYFNTTIGGVGQGNIYANVMDGSDGVSGSVSSPIPGLFIGTDGAVPYDQASSGNHMYQATDYAPLAPSDDNSTVCLGVLDTPNTVYTLSKDVHGFSGSGNEACFDVEADNITIDCMGHSMIGPANNGYYYNSFGSGVYSHAFNTTVQNCNISDYEYGVYFDGNSNGTITRDNFSNDVDGFYLYYSDYDSVFGNRMDSNENGFGVWYSNYNQIYLNSVTNSLSSNFYDESSCPLLYAWNGSSYGFVGDINGPGILSEPMGNGQYRKPTPADYIKINRLQQNGSEYDLQVTEEYNEISYLDQMDLLTVDHAPGISTYPTLVRANESFFYTVNDSDMQSPVSCVSDGKDCLGAITSPDGYYVSGGANKTTSIIVDLGNFSNSGPVKLLLGGYSVWGAVAPVQKSIQVVGSDGKWANAYSGSQLGRPTGFPRTYVIDLTGKFQTTNHTVNITFDAASFDYVAVDTSQQQPLKINSYNVSSADLEYRGYSVAENGSIPYPDYYSLSNLSFPDASGNFTKYGDVTSLLSSADDEYVIINHGDQMSVSFPYSPAAEGDVREFYLYSYGYYKPSEDLYGNSVYPLPFQNMSNYPYGANESYPADHGAYLSTWNTRSYKPSPPDTTGGSLPYSTGNMVFNNSIDGTSTSTGFYLYEETDTQLLDNNISDVAYGIYAEASTDVLNSGNSLQGIGGYAIYLSDNSGSNVTSNTINNATLGIYVDDDSSDLISGNSITHAASGISLTNGADSETVSGNTVSAGGTMTTFDYPNAVAYGPDGYVYVADTDNCLIERINQTTSETAIVAGQPQDCGYQEGVGSGALFDYPEALTFGSDGYLYVADDCVIRKINITTNETFLIAGNPSCSYQEGNGSSAYFESVRGIAFGPDGNLYVSDSENDLIRMINLTTNGTSLVAGVRDSWGYTENSTNGSYARFYYPTALSFGPDGYLYVTDSDNSIIRKINITTTGTYFVSGAWGCYYDGSAYNVSDFCYPDGLAFGQDGFLYISDSENYLIKKLNITTNQTYFVAGNPNSYYMEGIGANASFYYPEGLSAGPGNTIYVADSDNNRIRSIDTTTYQTSLVAGNGYSGYIFGYQYSALLLQDTGDHLIANNTFSSEMPVVQLFDTGDNLFVNNTLSSPSSDLLDVDSESGDNTFYWNSFTGTSALYVNDSSGSDSYDGTTPSETDEGNIWSNVMDGQVYINGTVASTGFPQYFVGTSGSGYPYSDATSLGKTIGVIDNAPLTAVLGTPTVYESSPSHRQTKTMSWSTSFNCSSGVLTATASDGSSGLEVMLFQPSGAYTETEQSDNGAAAFTVPSSGTYQLNQPSSGDYLSYTSDPMDLEMCSQPAANVTVNNTQNVTPPPSGQNNTNESINQTGSNTSVVSNTTAPSGPTQDQAALAISAAGSAISDASSSGKDTSAAAAELKQAEQAMAAGNYSDAISLANQAKELAANAAAAPPKPSSLPPVTTSTQPFNWLLLGGIVVIVLVVAGGIILLMRPGKKQKK